MKGAKELFVKATYYKKREGLGSPQWHFNTHPSHQSLASITGHHLVGPPIVSIEDELRMKLAVRE